MHSKFAFLRHRAQKVYNTFHIHKIFLDNMKFFFLGVWCVLMVILYAVYVNLASTAWYFLSEVQREQQEVEFSYNITKFNTTEYERSLRDAVQYFGKANKITIETDVVYLPTDEDISF